MKSAIRPLMSIVVGVALGVLLSFIDTHYILLLFLAHAAGMVFCLVSGKADLALLFSSGIGLGIIALYTHLLGSGLGGGGGYIISFGLGCLYGLPAIALACLGVGVARLALRRG